MEEILFFILQFFGELIVNLAGEIIFDIMGHGYSRFARQRSPMPGWLLFLLHCACGAAVGWATLKVFPESFAKNETMRYACLFVVPLLAGLVMAWIGRARTRRGRREMRLETFAQGTTFAFAAAFVRFVWAL